MQVLRLHSLLQRQPPPHVQLKPFPDRYWPLRGEKIHKSPTSTSNLTLGQKTYGGKKTPLPKSGIFFSKHFQLDVASRDKIEILISDKHRSKGCAECSSPHCVVPCLSMSMMSSGYSIYMIQQLDLCSHL